MNKIGNVIYSETEVYCKACEIEIEVGIKMNDEDWAHWQFTEDMKCPCCKAELGKDEIKELNLDTANYYQAIRFGKKALAKEMEWEDFLEFCVHEAFMCDRAIDDLVEKLGS